MNLDRAVLAVAGAVVLVSLLLAVMVSSWWLLLTGFVGLNLLQSSLTGFCPAAVILGRLGVPSGCAFSTHTAATASPRPPSTRTPWPPSRH